MMCPQYGSRRVEAKATYRVAPQRCREWENYDADEEIKRMENDEEEEQTKEHEVRSQCTRCNA